MLTPIETERLLLRELTVEDDAFILELLNDPDFIRYIVDRGVRDLEGAREYILAGPVASYREHGFGLYLVALKETGTPVGMCGLLRRETLPDVDIGFAFLHRYRGQGYAYEAASATVDHARALGLQRLVAITTPDNERSIRLVDRLGLRYEGVVHLPGYAGEGKLFGRDL